MTSIRLIPALVLGLLFSSAIEARTFKWKDEKGRTHYGETIPPEYANRSSVELDEKGRVIKSQEVLTAEERQAREAESARKRSADAAALDQRRHDRMLIQSYSSEAEIDAARERSLKQAELSLKDTQDRLKEARQKLDVRAGRSPGSERVADETLVAQLEQELAHRQAEIAAIKERAESDKLRYRELTGKKP
jgi:capsule polysaccharide export protein KpsE/RkpR